MYKWLSRRFRSKSFCECEAEERIVHTYLWSETKQKLPQKMHSFCVTMHCPICPSMDSKESPTLLNMQITSCRLIEDNYCSTSMSASRCILSWARLKIVIFAMFVHKCIFRFTIGATVGHILPPVTCICICSDWQHVLNSVSLSLCPTKKSCAFVSWNLLKRRLSVQGHQRIIFSELEWICSLLIQKKKNPMPLQGETASFTAW